MYRFSKLWVSLCVVVLVLALSVPFSSAQAPQDTGASKEQAPQAQQEAEPSQQEPITIEHADRALYDEASGTTRFIGNVRMLRENGYLYADEVTTYQNMQDSSLIKMVAEGHVDMKEGDLVATCGQMTFDQIKNVFELKESVVVLQNQNRYEADTLILDRATKKYDFQGNVRMRLIQKTQSEPTTEPSDDATASSDEPTSDASAAESESTEGTESQE